MALLLPGFLGTARAQNDSSVDVRASSDAAGYADSDHVYVLTPSLAATVASPTAGWTFGGQYLVDVVSAASVDIVSTASRHWTEVRQAGGLDAAYQPGALGVRASGSISSEPDYLSLGFGAAVTQDVLQKDVTWLLGFNHSHDIAGRTDTPFSVFSHPLNRESFKGGLTFVIDPATIASFVADAVFESGDPSKPYRYIPLFAPGTFVSRGATIDVVNSLRTSARPLEQLPLSRDRLALSLLMAHRYAISTLRLDERLYADSWGLDATTTDARFLIDVSRRIELGPHVRVHAQTPVVFWQRSYVLGPGFQVPLLRTGDRELGPLIGLTAGWRLGISLGPADHLLGWVLGWDLNVTTTRYLDDLYLTHRTSVLGGVSLEREL